MLGSDNHQTYEYYIYESLDDRQVWDNFLSWVRFCVFKGDMSELYEHVKQNQLNAVKKALEEKNGDEKWAAAYVVVKPQNLETEVNAWKQIKELAFFALTKFPTSLDEDLVFLQKV